MSGDFFTPAFNCPHEVERHGALGDGGKWVCGLSRLAKKPDCVVYSFGKYLKLFKFNFYIYIKEQASTTSHRSKRRSYPTLRIAKFGVMTSVSQNSDLKFQPHSSIAPISNLLDFRVLISMGRRTSRQCIHSRPS